MKNSNCPRVTLQAVIEPLGAVSPGSDCFTTPHSTAAIGQLRSTPANGDRKLEDDDLEKSRMNLAWLLLLSLMYEASTLVRRRRFRQHERSVESRILPTPRKSEGPRPKSSILGTPALEESGDIRLKSSRIGVAARGRRQGGGRITPPSRRQGGGRRPLSSLASLAAKLQRVTGVGYIFALHCTAPRCPAQHFTVLHCSTGWVRSSSQG